MKYSPEKKTEALASIAVNGVQKTSDEMNISLQTLYKWRNTGKSNSLEALSAQPETSEDGLLQLIHNEEHQAAVIQRLEEENAKLRDDNTRLRQLNTKLKIVVKAFLA